MIFSPWGLWWGRPSAQTIDNISRPIAWLFCRPILWLRRIPRGKTGREYLDRYSFREQKHSGRNARGWYLHHFRADDGDCLHSHPWGWAFSFILWGSYTEEYADLQCRVRHCYDECDLADCRNGLWLGPLRTRRVRWFNRIGPRRLHRIVQLHGNVWTLFFFGPVVQRWGFWQGGRLIRWDRKEPGGPC